MHAPDGDAPPAPFPERVGRYELLLPVASGGMATVYLARTSGLGGFEREVALKLTHNHLRETAGFAESLMDEANLAGRIHHPNVVSVLDVGEDPHGVYLVMEYVEGDTLAGLVRRADEQGTRLPERVAVRIVDDLLAGLHAAHELRDASGQLVGLVHRDVTPHNVLVGVDGVCKLADFGVAKAASRFSMTATGLIKGKVAYMAPEQALGHALNRTCDVWAAGVVLWELLSGMRLHVTASDAATLLRIVTEPPPRVRTVRADVPPELDDVVARALQMSPAKRYPTAAHLARDLEAAVSVTCGRAEQREVGEYVSQAVSSAVERRRRKIAEVLELRGRLSRITRSALPSQPATPSWIPAMETPSHDTTAVETPRPLGALGPTGPGGTLVLASSPRSTPPSADPGAEPTRTETISVATARAEARGSVRRRRVGIAAGATVALGIVAAVGSMATSHAERESGSSASSSNASTAPSSTGGGEVTPDDLPLAPSETDEERTLTVIASAPIAMVALGDREVTFDSHSPRQKISVTGAERGATLTVVTADGRRGAATVPRDSDELRIAVGSTRGARPGSARRQAEDPPPAAEPKQKGDGLLGNPYKSKQ